MDGNVYRAYWQKKCAVLMNGKCMPCLLAEEGAMLMNGNVYCAY